MKICLSLLGFLISLSGCGGSLSDTISCVTEGVYCTNKMGKSCVQSYQQVAVVENLTGKDLNIEMAYTDYSKNSDGIRTVLQVQVANGQTWQQDLGDYSSVIPGSQYDDGSPNDAQCTPDAQNTAPLLSLTSNSFDLVLDCADFNDVGEDDSSTYLLPFGSACPGVTQAQSRPL